MPVKEKAVKAAKKAPSVAPKKKGPPSSYSPDFIDIVPNVIKDGETLNALCVELHICKDTMRVWREENPAFDTAIKAALCNSELWWERLGKDRIGDKEFNATLYIVQMRNRFGWMGKDPVMPQVNVNASSLDEGLKLAHEISQKALKERK